MARNLGWMAAEFARLPGYTRENIENVVVLDGHENFLAGRSRGKGVIYLTGHIGAWELSSYAHALYGFPLHYMARPLDNAPLAAFVNEYRGRSGNNPIFKNEAARMRLKALKQRGTTRQVAGPVRGCGWWSRNWRKYRVRFGPPVERVRTGDAEGGVQENTQGFARVMEEIIGKHREKWVRIHARGKNGPEGEPPLYEF